MRHAYLTIVLTSILFISISRADEQEDLIIEREVYSLDLVEEINKQESQINIVIESLNSVRQESVQRENDPLQITLITKAHPSN